MSDHSSGPGPGGGGDESRDDGGQGPSRRDTSHWLRGLGIVVVAAVVGILLMPSATRPPIQVATAARSSTGSSTTGATVPSTTTTSTLPTIVPGASSIKVLVGNGTTIAHLAAGVSAYLHSRGYDTLAPVNATTHVTGTQVYAAAGQQGAAGTVASVLGEPASAVQPATAVAPVAGTGGASVVVIAGPELARLATSAGG